MTTVSSNLKVFSMDSAAMKANYLVEVPIGDLELADGRLVAMDPLTMPDMEAFERKAPEGVYPVTFIRGDEEYARPALLVIRFSDEPVTRFELATRPGQRMEDLEEGYFYGIPVDTGLAAFANSGFAEAVAEREAKAMAEAGDDYISYYDDVLIDLFPGDGPDEAAIHHPLEDQPAAAAISQSGWGDGFYPVIWGLDRDEKPALAFIDFYVIEDGEGLDADEMRVRKLLDAMTPSQKDDNLAAYQALVDGDDDTVIAYLADGRIKPKEPVIVSGGSFMSETIRLDRPAVLAAMLEAGVDNTPGEADSGWVESYTEYARALDKSGQEGKIEPRSAALMALIEKLDSRPSAE